MCDLNVVKHNALKFRKTFIAFAIFL